MSLFYVETGIGCCVRAGRSEDSVERAVLREVGTMVGVKGIRKATEKDIAWVRCMGGRIPNETNAKEAA